MDLLNRAVFIETIRHLSKYENPLHTLIYTEINHALQVARLLGGTIAQEQLLNAIQALIFSKTNHLNNSRISQLNNNGFGIIVRLSVKDSVDFAEELAGFLDRQCITIDGRSYYPKLIIGITAISPEYKTAERILTAVDEALYQARRAGNSVVKLIGHDDPDLHAYYNSLALLPVLRKGLLNNAFVLYAQPIVPIAQTVSRTKAEILLRYKNEQGDIESPQAFLRTADLFHISREVDAYVVHQFCRFIGQQKQQDIVYSLNISGQTIRHPPFFDMVAKEFKRFGIIAEQVCFEVTESVAERDFSQAVKLMHLLKDRLGCQLALDDIGIGSSNLANLSKFNVDYMKIDGWFIRQLIDNPYSELVINFIVSAAKLYGKKTIAEHVENSCQIKRLEKLSIDYSQGYLTGKPELLFDPSLS